VVTMGVVLLQHSVLAFCCKGYAPVFTHRRVHYRGRLSSSGYMPYTIVGHEAG
jgi:hypothetical protein